MWIRRFTSPWIQKTPLLSDRHILQKAEAEMGARRQNGQVGFHPLPNAEIPDPRRFGKQDPRGSGYQTLPKSSHLGYLW